MSKHMKDEYEKMNRGRHKEPKEKKRKNMVGEITRKDSGYTDSGFGKVQEMLTGKHPTTNICTNAVGAGKK